jgi:hypothetical protein
MCSEYDAPQEGEVKVHENELAHAFENRVYIFSEDGERLIGRALQLKREPVSSYQWLLIDVSCTEELPHRIRIIAEQWRLDSIIFHEGYGWMNSSTRTEPESIELDRIFHVTRLGVTRLPREGSLHLYRYVTLEERKNIR